MPLALPSRLALRTLSNTTRNNGGMILTGKNCRTRRKTCPSALSTTNPTWTDTDLRGERPKTNHLSHSAIYVLILVSGYVFRLPSRRVSTGLPTNVLYSIFPAHLNILELTVQTSKSFQKKCQISCYEAYKMLSLHLTSIILCLNVLIILHSQPNATHTFYMAL
jgi:hypothetical protein